MGNDERENRTRTMDMTQGFSVIISQKFGAGQEGELRRAVFQAALLSVIAAVLLTGLGQAALPAVLS